MSWSSIIKGATNFVEYLQFLLSKEFVNTSCQNISSHLVADIILSRRKFLSGDRQDINNIATYMPYCNYFLTDRTQMNRIKKYGFDSKYQTKVFCMKTIDEFIDTI